MAQAELNIAIDKMSGKIYGDSDVYITHRYGKTVISHYPKHRDPNSLTPHQRELNTSFALCIQHPLKPKSNAAFIMFPITNDPSYKYVGIFRFANTTITIGAP